MPSAVDNYDLIAPIYDVDMALNMPFDDGAYYLTLARQTGGRVLELGCGNGRILGALQCAGIDCVGLDRASAMLRNARARGSRGLVQADLRRLPFRAVFDLVLLPYSLITYLLDDDDWAALAHGLNQVLSAAGARRVVIDAFLPRPQLADAGWQHDYARRYDDHWLVRHKRVQRLNDGGHRIERRYRHRGSFDGRTLTTCEHIRPYVLQELLHRIERFIGPVQRLDYDYATCSSAEGARFVTATIQCRQHSGRSPS